MFQAGQRVICINEKECKNLKVGKKYTITKVWISGTKHPMPFVNVKECGDEDFFASRFSAYTPTNFNLKDTMKDLLSAAKGFINENRNIFFWLATAFLLDHFLFKGAFRERFKNIVEGMIKKVEEQIK